MDAAREEPAELDAALAWALGAALLLAPRPRNLVRSASGVALGHACLVVVEVPAVASEPGCRLVAVGSSKELGGWDASKAPRLTQLCAPLGLWATPELRLRPAHAALYRYLVVRRDGSTASESPVRALPAVAAGERAAALSRWSQPSEFLFRPRPRPRAPLRDLI